MIERSHTPQPYEFTLAAGARLTLHDYNRMITFIDVTSGHSLQWAIGDEPTVEVMEGLTYELPQDQHLSKIQFYNAGAANCTVKFILSEGRVLGDRMNISDVLEEIRDRLAGEATMTQLSETTVAATGSTGTSLFAANASRKRALVVASLANGGYVYLGDDNSVSATNYFAVLAPGGSWLDENYQGAVYAVGGAAGYKVGGYEV